ncbi:MAG: bifunctional methionine sulfoxide reductase B/A protein, partial [Lentisphaerae bacterium]
MLLFQADELSSRKAGKEVQTVNGRDYNPLSPEERRVIVEKGTEPPFSGEYNEHFANGVYCCRRCGAELYESDSKFRSHCGWPSFDDEIEGAVCRVPDADGVRTEIVCANCGGHLGHVFVGEQLTPKNIRHCVNSLSLRFVPADERPHLERAVFAGGCFWGVEYHLQQLPGVRTVVSGYTGGKVPYPSYRQVCSGNTGHVEAVLVRYDPSLVSYRDLAKVFFEIHDPTQKDGQGPDIGSQYRSAVFWYDDEQRRIVESLIAELRQRGLDVATRVQKAGPFYAAEPYHQNYYLRKG